MSVFNRLDVLSIYSLKKFPTRIIVRNLFGNAEKKKAKREEILGEMKKGYLADLKEVKASGGKRYLALSEPFPQQESVRFPTFHGISLAGKPVVFPRDSLGKVALVLLWTREHGQKMCGIYHEAFVKEFQHTRNIECYEVNIVDSWLFKILRNVINKNLRQQVPQYRQENFICFYDNPSTLIQTIFENTLVGHAVLVDNKGLVRWKAHGIPTDEELRYLVNCTNSLRNETPESDVRSEQKAL